MRPMVFTDRESVAEFLVSLARYSILDDIVYLNPAQWIVGCLIYEIETVPGVVILDGIFPNREASVHIFLAEKPGKRAAELLKECRSAIIREVKRMGLKRLAAYIAEDNKPSRYFTSRLGFKFEGITRKSHCVNGVFKNVACYSITDDDLMEGEKNERNEYIREYPGTDWERADDDRPKDCPAGDERDGPDNKITKTEKYFWEWAKACYRRVAVWLSKFLL